MRRVSTPRPGLAVGKPQAPAIELLSGLSRIEGNPYVLPGAVPGRHYVALEKAWRRLRGRAGLDDVRLHDLRHSFASTGAGTGESLVLIGAAGAPKHRHDGALRAALQRPAQGGGRPHRRSHRRGHAERSGRGRGARDTAEIGWC